MKQEDVWKVYHSNYAKAYNERYLLNPFSKVTVATELSVLKKIIDKETRWLDIGCGTAYFLSQFPGIQRAGLDMSPEMIKLASEVNSDALFFQQGDFRKKMPEWENEWSLVSCMWCAYSYVDSMKEVEQVLTNMIDWTKPRGSVFIPVVDIEDVRPNLLVPYEENVGVFGGKIYLTSATWTWIEDEADKVHTHLVAAHVEHFIKLMQPWFDEIEVVRYPPYMTGWVSRKAVLAKGKRSLADHEHLGKIKWHPIPPPEIASGNQSPNDPRNIISSLSHKQLIGELFGRMKSGRTLSSFKRKIFSKK